MWRGPRRQRKPGKRDGRKRHRCGVADTSSTRGQRATRVAVAVAEKIQEVAADTAIEVAAVAPVDVVEVPSSEAR